MNFSGIGLVLMIVSAIGFIGAALMILSTNRSKARKKEEIYRSVHDEYSRR